MELSRTRRRRRVGAAVQMVNPATGVEFTTVTTDAGVYRMPSLPPGTYRITVTAPGFKSAVRDNVVLSVAQTLTLDFALEVGSITEQITVSAESPLLETGTAEIGSYVSKKEFDTWPITVGDGRRQIQQFIFTALPGTAGSTWQGSINGGQQYSHEILIDGIAIGRMDLAGGANNEFSPSAESDQRIQTADRHDERAVHRRADGGFQLRDQVGHQRASRLGYYYGQNDALRANSFNSNASGVHAPAVQAAQLRLLGRRARLPAEDLQRQEPDVLLPQPGAHEAEGL